MSLKMPLLDSVLFQELLVTIELFLILNDSLICSFKHNYVIVTYSRSDLPPEF